MKNNWHKFLAFGFVLLFTLGCSAIGRIKQEFDKTQAPKVLTGTDGKTQITIPGGWRVDKELNEQAVLQASNRVAELYIVVIAESKEDFTNEIDVDAITKLSQEGLREGSTDVTISETTTTVVDGNPARQFEASASVSGLKAKYIYTIVASPQNYYQIITWTIASRYAANKPKLLEVTNSFKEISADAPPPPPPPAAF